MDRQIAETRTDMHHHETYMSINFQQNRVGRSVKTVHTNLFAKIASCINMQLRIVIFQTSNISDMCHRRTYIYINFSKLRL